MTTLFAGPWSRGLAGHVAHATMLAAPRAFDHEAKLNTALRALTCLSFGSAQAHLRGEGGKMRKQSGLSLTHSLVETLGLAIITGHYTGTDFPNESELSQQLRASRTATREAIKMLTSKGLISARPRHGTAVAPESDWNLLDPDVLRWLLERKFSLRLMIQFTEMRLGIEPAAAALAARNADSAGLACIQKALARMSDAAAGEDDALSADVAFHVAILDATKNAFYRDLHELVNTALRISIRFTNSIEGHSSSLPAHHAVADAIGARDSVMAQAAMETIIQDVLRLIRRSAQGQSCSLS